MNEQRDQRDINMKYFIVFCIALYALSVFADSKTYTVAGDSMSPALVSGDRVVVSSDRMVQLSRGDLVAIRFKHSDTPIVKRVVAVEGDRVEIKDASILVNGQKYRQIDMARWKTTMTQLERYGWVVPSKNIFVLGDNPDSSLDSRRLGLISVDQVEGRVVKIIRKDE